MLGTYGNINVRSSNIRFFKAYGHYDVLGEYQNLVHRERLAKIKYTNMESTSRRALLIEILMNSYERDYCVIVEPICFEHYPSVLIESEEEPKAEDFRDTLDICITAGVSTPVDIIKEVEATMTENNNGENFEAMLEESLKNSNTNEKVVEGIVVSIAPTEIYVDVGRKQSGIVELAELTDNTNLTPVDCVKVGDKLELMILRTNDQDGYIYLSKRILDSSRAWDEIKAASPKIVNRSRRRDDDNENEGVLHANDEAEAPAPAASEAIPEVIEQNVELVVFTGYVTEIVKDGRIVSYSDDFKSYIRVLLVLPYYSENHLLPSIIKIIFLFVKYIYRSLYRSRCISFSFLLPDLKAYFQQFVSPAINHRKGGALRTRVTGYFNSYDCA